MIQGLNEEGLRATLLLKGLVVKRIVRHMPKEVCIEFTDGSRLFVDWHETTFLELSVQGGNDLGETE